MAKKRGRGRPQMYPLTERQMMSIIARIHKGETSPEILKAMPSVHEFALLRVRREMRG
jgi:hypothetical protein